jgi:hypothetical protein
MSAGRYRVANTGRLLARDRMLRGMGLCRRAPSPKRVPTLTGTLIHGGGSIIGWLTAGMLLEEGARLCSKARTKVLDSVLSSTCRGRWRVSLVVVCGSSLIDTAACGVCGRLGDAVLGRVGNLACRQGPEAALDELAFTVAPGDSVGLPSLEDTPPSSSHTEGLANGQCNGESGISRSIGRVFSDCIGRTGELDELRNSSALDSLSET